MLETPKTASSRPAPSPCHFFISGVRAMAMLALLGSSCMTVKAYTGPRTGDRCHRDGDSIVVERPSGQRLVCKPVPGCQEEAVEKCVDWDAPCETTELAY